MRLSAATVRFILTGFLLLGADGTVAQTVVPNVNALKSGNYGSTSGATVTLAGFYNVGDGGGGVLVSAPTSPTTYPIGTCMTAQGLAVNNSSGAGQIQNVSPFPIGLTMNMVVTGTGVASGTTNTSYSVANQTITLSQGVTAQQNTATYAFGLTANATYEAMYLDALGFCFTRANQTWSQKEFGAYSDGSSTVNPHDDTLALHAWMYANQPHIGVGGIRSSATLCTVAWIARATVT